MSQKGFSAILPIAFVLFVAILSGMIYFAANFTAFPDKNAKTNEAADAASTLIEGNYELVSYMKDDEQVLAEAKKFFLKLTLSGGKYKVTEIENGKIQNEMSAEYLLNGDTIVFKGYYRESKNTPPEKYEDTTFTYLLNERSLVLKMKSIGNKSDNLPLYDLTFKKL